MKILIAGPGAMGMLFAGRLCAAGANDVCLLDHNAGRARLLNKTGIRITVKPLTTADLILIFVKAFDTAAAARGIIPAIGKDTVILTLQNGLGNAETIEKVLAGRSKRIPVLAGTTSEAATLVRAGVVEHTGKGETAFGHYCGPKPVPGKMAQIERVFNSAGIKTKIVKDVENRIWSKLIINSAVNPLGAITRRKNGELLKDGLLREMLFAVAEESASVARRKGIKLPYGNPSQKVEEVCRATSGNYNSMLQDVLKGRKTEIDFINGAIIDAAVSVRPRLATPLNKMLYCLIKLMAKQALNPAYGGIGKQSRPGAGQARLKGTNKNGYPAEKTLP